MSGRKGEASFEDFRRLEIRAGTVLSAEPFPEARKPALKMAIHFGEPLGVLHSSAQLTRRYTAQELVGTRVLAVVNLPGKRIAGFPSECLVLGVVNPEDPGDVVLVRPDRADTIGWELG
ncbi:MAG TPA: tRNA-binding protein [Longimicrobiales bacterium]|nr:tRNA-binding protein [Longimicrobiales bacterium]